MTVGAATAETFDWTHPSMRVDPHPTCHRFRARSPVHRNDMGWWVLGHKEAERVLHASEFSRRRERFLQAFRLTLGEGQAYEYVTRRLTYYGPPDHARLRGTVSRAFTPRRVQAMRPFIAGLANKLLDEVAGEDEFDILEHLAHPLPSQVICQMLGVPEDLRAQFDEWTGLIPHLIAPTVTEEQLAAGTRAVIEEWACVEGLIEERRAEPGDDLLSALIEAEEGGQRLTREELVANIIFMFSAGHQTTRDTLGVGLIGMLADRIEYEDLVAHRELAPRAVEESLRWSSVVGMAVEQAQAALRLHDAEIAAGDWVWVVLPAVNRDPLVFTNPDRFHIRRPNSTAHLAFSGGPHFCLGAALGRLELTVLFEVLSTRFPGLELADPVADIAWRDTLYFRGPRNLRVSPGG
ncbi:MAG: cytochrome P450 [Acidimicrobiia bacterium]